MAKPQILDLSGNTIVADGFKGKVTNTAVQALTAVTDSSGGAAANGTIEVVGAATAASTDTSAASLASTNTAITALKAAITELSTKLNAVIAAIKA